MKIYDTKSKEKCAELEISESDNQIEQVGILTLIQQGQIVDKNMNVLV